MPAPVCFRFCLIADYVAHAPSFFEAGIARFSFFWALALEKHRTGQREYVSGRPAFLIPPP